MEKIQTSKKSLSNGVNLIKKQLTTETGESINIFELEVIRLITVKFTLDLSGSENVKIEDSDKLTITQEIPPFCSKIVAKIFLKVPYSLKTKFK